MILSAVFYNAHLLTESDTLMRSVTATLSISSDACSVLIVEGSRSWFYAGHDHCHVMDQACAVLRALAAGRVPAGGLDETDTLESIERTACEVDDETTA